MKAGVLFSGMALPTMISSGHLLVVASKEGDLSEKGWFIMPIINIKFIENVVATPDQKHELVREMTNTFVKVLGDVVRPFTYVVIEETKMYDWGIAGQPMPDLAWLTGPENAEIMGKSQAIMRTAVAQMAEQAASDQGEE